MEFIKQQWEFIGTDLSDGPIHSFAIDDMLQIKVSNDKVPKLRAWVHHPYIILGLHDMKVPNLEDGLKVLREYGYKYIVRNSGGLGVVLDSGVLNLSLVLPRDAFRDIDDGYQLMYELIKDSFGDYKIDANDIVDSYCPGSFDLSIDGKKFAGISQRRIRNGVAVQIYISVTGDGAERARVMRDFYRASVGEEETKFSYPKVNPGNMASLDLLTGLDLDIHGVLERIVEVLRRYGASFTEIREFDKEDADEIERQMQRMLERNKDLIE